MIISDFLHRWPFPLWTKMDVFVKMYIVSFPSYICSIFLSYCTSQEFQYDKKNSDKKEHPCFVSNHNRNVLIFLPLSMIPCVNFFIDILCQINKVFLYSWFSVSFCHDWRWISSNALLPSMAIYKPSWETSEEKLCWHLDLGLLATRTVRR